MKLTRTSTPQERIKILVNTLGISQKELAMLCRIRQASISNYVQGKCEPEGKTIMKIAETVGVSPAWIMGYGPTEPMERM